MSSVGVGEVSGVRTGSTPWKQIRPSYPTRSLRFLEALKPIQNGLPNGTTEDSAKSIKLNVMIAGAGLGGLATAVALTRSGHNVRVFEQAPALAEVGAGIQIPSNSSRLLLKWGIEPFLKSSVVEPGGITFRRWQSGTAIGYTKLIPDFRDTFKAPYWVIHRAHFHDALYRLAQELGVEVFLNSHVQSYNVEDASLTLDNGATYEGDLIIGADGLKSAARTAVLGNDDVPPYAPGYAAYRATVDVEQMKADPETAWLVEKPNLNIWIGDSRHVMTYAISSGRSFNMVFSHPEKSDPSTWNRDSELEDMMKHFKGWDHRLLKVMRMIKSTMKWPLMSGRPLKRWVHPSGKMLVLGDAAHAMLPYMSQGAAMAVEDAASLSAILAKVENKNKLKQALAIFEKVRILRTSQMQEASLLNGLIWHYADGPEQRARDSAMQSEVLGDHFIESPNQWSDPLTQIWCYDYDAEEEALKAWAESNSNN